MRVHGWTRSGLRNFIGMPLGRAYLSIFSAQLCLFLSLENNHHFCFLQPSIYEWLRGACTPAGSALGQSELGYLQSFIAWRWRASVSFEHLVQSLFPALTLLLLGLWSKCWQILRLFNLAPTILYRTALEACSENNADFPLLFSTLLLLLWLLLILLDLFGMRSSAKFWRNALVSSTTAMKE